MTDPIADMLTRIRNAVTAKHTRVDMPTSRLKAEIARILHDEGYIQGFKLLEDPGNNANNADGASKGDVINKTLRLFLKYGPHGEKLITGIERISRPGRRVYFGRNDVPDVLAGLGTSILTTSRGVMTGREAMKAGVGGEVLCNIW
jgi:small subunit ribosomal protein S8